MKVQIQKHYRYSPSTGGHAPGHLRDLFEQLVERLAAHESVEADTLIDEGMTARQIIGSVWNCTDALNSYTLAQLDDMGWTDEGRHATSYAAAARYLSDIV